MWHPTVGSLFVRSSSVEQGGVSRHGALSCGNLPSCRCLTRGRPPCTSKPGWPLPESSWTRRPRAALECENGAQCIRGRVYRAADGLPKFRWAPSAWRPAQGAALRSFRTSSSPKPLRVSRTRVSKWGAPHPWVLIIKSQMVHLIKVAGGAAEPSSASRDDDESVESAAGSAVVE